RSSESFGDELLMNNGQLFLRIPSLNGKVLKFCVSRICDDSHVPEGLHPHHISNTMCDAKFVGFCVFQLRYCRSPNFQLVRQEHLVWRRAQFVHCTTPRLHVEWKRKTR